jgi:curved DNA-binding protein CbpA
MSDPYHVLQVDRDADPVVIRATFRALAHKYHPDFGGDTARMVAINEAWRILGNERRRAVYDAASQTYESDGSVVVAGPGSFFERGPVPAPPNRNGRETGTTLDFGRYAGWSLARLADHDPDYLEWLERAPAGRRVAAEIRSIRAQRAPVATMTPRSHEARRRRR